MTDENPVRAGVLVAAGTNCDRETMRAFRAAGAEAERLHIRSLVDDPDLLDRYRILSIPGGFSYGDDLGAGTIFGNELRFLIGEEFRSFVEDGGLVLGICNGFQVLVRSGLLPGGPDGDRQNVTLTDNDSGRFECRWVHLSISGDRSAFLPDDGMDALFLPVAHAEGKFLTEDATEPTSSDHNLLTELDERGQVIFRYAGPGGTAPSYPWNPNGALSDVAALSDETGQILGMMPHPERFYQPVQHPTWQRRNELETPDGLRLLQTGVETARSV